MSSPIFESLRQLMVRLLTGLEQDTGHGHQHHGWKPVMNLSPDNHSPAKRVQTVLANLARNGDSDHESLIDLLTDAMHWCDAHGEDFHFCLAMACRHYINQLNDDNTTKGDFLHDH